MKRVDESNLWHGVVDGDHQIVNVVGTYGPNYDPIVRVEEGKDAGLVFAIKWDTGEVIVELDLY